MTRDASPPRCPSCSGDALRRIGAILDARLFAGQEVEGVLPISSLYSCLACELKFRYPILEDVQYEELYDTGCVSAWPDEPSDRKDWSLVAEYLGQHAGAGASVLDFGCYTGGLLGQLGSRYARFGVEVNTQAGKVAQEKTGAEVVPSLESFAADRKFDFVTAVDVVEHFADPGSTIASLLAIVKPGGALLITTGDADNWLWRLSGAHWWYAHYPEHLAFVSEHWIRDWLRRADGHATLADVRRFRYLRLTPPRYALQSCLFLAHLAAPRGYARLMRRLKRVLGRHGDVKPPGIGLTKDHLFLAIRKLP